ncbi:hypothetical protein J6590_028738 [Homalodisca vitripennis]|nr:hypothetical protein J6590_028738 [Homalodisca vitripennis]
MDLCLTSPDTSAALLKNLVKSDVHLCSRRHIIANLGCGKDSGALQFRVLLEGLEAVSSETVEDYGLKKRHVYASYYITIRLVRFLQFSAFAFLTFGCFQPCTI